HAALGFPLTAELPLLASQQGAVSLAKAAGALELRLREVLLPHARAKSGPVKKISYWIVCSLMLLAASPAVAQTFEIGGKSTTTAPAVDKNAKTASPAAAGKRGGKKPGKGGKGAAASGGASS